MGSFVTWSGHRMIDPSEMEARFSLEDSFMFVESIFDEPSEEALEKIERVQEIMEYLPNEEADFIDLFFFKHKKQTDIAEIFDCSQPTVCYRLKRGAYRIKLFLEIPDVSKDELKNALERVLVADPKDVEIMLLMNETRSQSATAKILGESQGLVRHRFLRSLNALREANIYQKFVELYEFISENLNALRALTPKGEGNPPEYVIG